MGGEKGVRFPDFFNPAKIKDDLSGAKRMMGKVSYMCGALLSEFMVNGRDRDERFLDTVFVRANISCKSKIELSYYLVACYTLVVCIYYYGMKAHT